MNAGFPVRQVAFDNIQVGASFPNGGLGANSCTFGLDVFLGGALSFHGSASPALPAGFTDNLGLGGELGPQPYQFSRLTITAAIGAELTGIDASAAAWPYNGGSVDGYVLFLFNAGANPFTLKNNIRSTVGNRLKLPGAADLVVDTLTGVSLMYLTSVQAWVKCA